MAKNRRTLLRILAALPFLSFFGFSKPVDPKKDSESKLIQQVVDGPGKYLTDNESWFLPNTVDDSWYLITPKEVVSYEHKKSPLA